MTVVEILDQRSYRPRDSDPKFALRLGFADVRRLTQFIVTPRRPDHRAKAADTRFEKLKSCWQDGLRQLGHRIVPRHSLGDAIPADIQYVGFWLVKRRTDGPTREAGLVPVAVRIRPGAGGGEAITGWDHVNGSWLPYAEFLLRLSAQAVLPVAVDDTPDGPDPAGQDRPEDPSEDAEEDDGTDTTEPGDQLTPGRLEKRRVQVADAVQELLFSLRDTPALLLVHAQNARRFWPWLQNAVVQKDHVQIHGGPVQRLALQGPDLRLVRLRDKSGDETSQWWARDKPSGSGDGDADSGETAVERAGIAKGLWRSPFAKEDNRVFSSTSPKSSSATNSAVVASRWSFREYTRNGRTGMTIDTGRPAWNPALLEVAVIGCQPGDDPEAWAALTHQLRMAPDYRDMLALPLPNHLARKAQEYVLPVHRAGDEQEAEDGTAVQLFFDLFDSTADEG